MLQKLHVQTTIPYHDFDRARAFYEDKLGLIPTSSRDGYVIFDCGGGTSFALYPSGGAGTAQNTAMSFLTDDIAAVAADLQSRGVVFEEYDYPDLKTVNGIADITDGRVAWFKDTEGNTLAITQRA